MKKTLFTAGAAITILAAAFFVVRSGSADAIIKSNAEVTFNKDVAPILFKNCAECHRPGEAAPMSLCAQVRFIVADLLQIQAIHCDSEGDQIHGDRIP
jgi:hypothetical protein